MPISEALVRRAVDNIERCAGHTTRCVNAARLTGATLIVDRPEIADSLRAPGVKVASLQDLARGIVSGPILLDPNVLQFIHGYPVKERWAHRSWTTPPADAEPTRAEMLIRRAARSARAAVAAWVAK